MNKKKPEHEKACNKGKIKISIMIPAYNSEKTIREAIESALAQTCPYKEVVVVDDCSTDRTVEIASSYPQVRVVKNEQNLGIGVNLAKCFVDAKAPYLLFLCGDDVFCDVNVASDIVNIFDEGHNIGFVGRNYYQFMDGKPGAVMRCDDDNIFLSSCCPSGMAFRKTKVWGSNKIFIEMPLIVAQYLETKKWAWTKLTYDPVAVRIHPGGNTGTLSTYYTESPYKVYTEFLGKDFQYHPMLIQLKNRAPHLLKDEIKLMLQTNPSFKKDYFFWFCAITATVVPGFILRPLSAFYRDKVSRKKAYIVKRGA